MGLSKPINMGRRKIELKRISDEAARQVTFSKRRAGLFKKASELCIMCGTETAILVFSPAGKAYSFGHPSIETVMDRFLINQDSLSKTNLMKLPLTAIDGGVKVWELKRQFVRMVEQLEEEKKKGNMLREMVKLNHDDKQLIGKQIEDLDLKELEKLRALMEEVKKYVAKRIVEASSMGSSSPSSILEVHHAIGVVDPFGASDDVLCGLSSHQRRLF